MAAALEAVHIDDFIIVTIIDVDTLGRLVKIEFFGVGHSTNLKVIFFYNNLLCIIL